MDTNNLVSTEAVERCKSLMPSSEVNCGPQGITVEPKAAEESKGSRRIRVRRSAKNMTIQGRRERRRTRRGIESSNELYSHPVPLFPYPSSIPSDDESLASTAAPNPLDLTLADEEASDPLQAAYQELLTRNVNLQETLTCLQNGNAPIREVADKRQTVTEMKTELRSIQGDVAALKETLKSLLGLSP
jgi:hypothetical protein